jgi:hypothetical protein
MIAGQEVFDRFIIEAFDPETDCSVVEARVDPANAAAVMDLLPPDVRATLQAGASWDLERDEVARIKARVDLRLESGSLPVRIRPAYPHDELPYQVHTGRELALMLEGRKPLAAFSLWQPLKPNREEFPERFFDPHVDSGAFIKRERLEPAYERDGQQMPASRRILYALPSQAWRIDAYLLLYDTAAKAGWNEGFERMEGSLLGYEDWQNDIFIERIYRTGVRRRSTS